MKKLVYLITLFMMLFTLSFNVLASEDSSVDNENILDDENKEVVYDSTIIKFDYYPGGSLLKERELTFEWISIEKMENLLISVFNPNLKKYVDVFDITWDLEAVDSTFDVDFKIVNEPKDDPLTPDIDETIDSLWEYKLTFKLAKDTYGLLKFKFVYDCEGISYENLFYLPNVVYPSVVVPPVQQDPNNDPNNNNNNNNDNNDSYFTTSNALIAAILATICSVIGTLLIIFSSQFRKLDDEDIK